MPASIFSSARRSISFRASFGVLAATVAALLPTVSQADSTSFKGTPGQNWFSAANWTNGEPTATKDAYLNAPNWTAQLWGDFGYAQNIYVGAGGSGSLHIYQGNEITNTVILGRDAGDQGTIALEGGIEAATIIIGQSGTGSLTLKADSNATSGYLNTTVINMAVNAGSSGTFTIGSPTDTYIPALIAKRLSDGTPATITGGAGTAKVVFNSSQNFTLEATLAGRLSVQQTGSGVVTLTGANTYTGGTTVSSGTLQGNATSVQGNITDNATVLFQQDTAGTYSGALTGTGNVTKKGAGNLTVSGSLANTGTLAVNEGTLTVTGSLGAAGTMVNNTSVIFQPSANSSYGGNMSGPGTVTKTGPNNLTLTGHSTNAQTVVNGGTLTLGDGTANNSIGILSGSLVINSGATVNAVSSNAFGYADGTKINAVTITGGTLNSPGQAGSGDQGWGVAYTLDSATMVSNGGVNDAATLSKFAFGNNTSVTVNGTGTSTISGRVDLRGDLGVTNVNFTVNTGATLNIPAVVTSASVSLTKLGNGTLNLSAQNTYTNTIVSGGTLTLGSNGQANGGIGILRGSLTINSGGTVNALASNAFGFSTGTKIDTVTIDHGTLNHLGQAGSADQGWGVAYTLNGATMTAASGNDPVNSLCKFSFGNNTSVTVNGPDPSTISGRVDLRSQLGVTNVNFTVNTGSSLVVNGPITYDGYGTVGITKLGAGAMTINGLNTFQGDVHVNGGTLNVGTNGIVGSDGIMPNVTVATGASLVTEGGISGSVSSSGLVAGSGSISGRLTLTSGGKFSPGNNFGIFFVGGLTMQSGSTLDLEIGRTTPGYNYDLIQSDGSVTLAGNVHVTDLGAFNYHQGQTFYMLQSPAAITGTFANVLPTSSTTGILYELGATYVVNYADHYGIPSNPNAVSFTLVPELSSPLLLLGATGLLARRRYRKIV